MTDQGGARAVGDHIRDDCGATPIQFGLGFRKQSNIGAFNDERVKEIVDMPENEAPLYVIPVGKKT